MTSSIASEIKDYLANFITGLSNWYPGYPELLTELQNFDVQTFAESWMSVMGPFDVQIQQNDVTNALACNFRLWKIIDLEHKFNEMCEKRKSLIAIYIGSIHSLVKLYLNTPRLPSFEDQLIGFSRAHGGNVPIEELMKAGKKIMSRIPPNEMEEIQRLIRSIIESPELPDIVSHMCSMSGIDIGPLMAMILPR